MNKEIVIIITIIIVILALNAITQNYTKWCVAEVSLDLNNLKKKVLEKIDEEDSENLEIENNISDIHDKWDEMNKKLAFYIEHDELEKVKTCLTNIKSNIETEELEHSIENLDSCIFILEHIEDKEMLSLANIF